jgi:hypothetical protein
MPEHFDSKIARSAHEAVRDMARRVAAASAHKRPRHEHNVEMLFAHLKRILKLDRLRLRGMAGATDELTLALRCRTCDGWPNFYLKGHRLRDRYAGISKNFQINLLTKLQRSTAEPKRHATW